MPSLGRFAKTRYLPELPEGHPGIRIKNAALDSVLDNNASLDARAVRARCCSGRNLAVAGWLTGWQAAFKRFQCIIHMYITVEMVALGAVLLDFRRCVSGSASFFFSFSAVHNIITIFFSSSLGVVGWRERETRGRSQWRTKGQRLVRQNYLPWRHALWLAWHLVSWPQYCVRIPEYTLTAPRRCDGVCYADSFVTA